MNNIPFYYQCKSCGNRGKAQTGQDACIKFKIPINIEEDFCSFHTDKAITKCVSCGNEATNIWMFEDIFLPLCSSCSSTIGTCASCNNSLNCDFENDHSEPSFVFQTVTKGLMRMQTQVKNPTLIDRHCKHCVCGNPEGHCYRDESQCSNWKIRQDLLYS